MPTSWSPQVSRRRTASRRPEQIAKLDAWTHGTADSSLLSMVVYSDCSHCMAPGSDQCGIHTVVVPPYIYVAVSVLQLYACARHGGFMPRPQSHRVHRLRRFVQTRPVVKQKHVVGTDSQLAVQLHVVARLHVHNASAKHPRKTC